MTMKMICIHFIDSETEKLHWKEFVYRFPRSGDIVRFGGLDKEKYFRITEF